MHKYLRAIGFSQIKNRKQLNELLLYAMDCPNEQTYVSLEKDLYFAEYSKDFAENIGLVLRGEYDENHQFTLDYYFPYCMGSNVSSYEEVTVERHAEKASYAGVCDDLKLGMSMIFYLRNVIPYMKREKADWLPAGNTSLMLSGLSLKGTIMMPIIKNERERKKVKQAANTRNHLIAAARAGDEEAIESLTLEDMDTYSTISKRILREDVFSLVDTYFMPYGVECDQYSVLGEIIDCRPTTNSLTKEELYLLSIECNEVLMDICINKEDLLGEPLIGRRFKGTIWMQGFVNFE